MPFLPSAICGKRRVVNSVQCLRCLMGSEDTVHAFWSCPALYIIWEGNEVLKKLLRYEFDTFGDLLGMVFFFFFFYIERRRGY